MIRIATILLVSTLIGAVWAHVKKVPWAVDAAAVKQRLAKAKQVEAKRKEIPKSVFIDLARFKELIGERAAIIDARDRQAYEEQHLAVDYQPPVLNIYPEDDLGPNLDRLFQLAGIPIVLYCNSKVCPLSEELYVLLDEVGVTANSPVYIYKAGWDGIEKSGLPRTSGPDEWTGFGATQPADEGEASPDGDLAGDEDPGEGG